MYAWSLLLAVGCSMDPTHSAWTKNAKAEVRKSTHNVFRSETFVLCNSVKMWPRNRTCKNKYWGNLSLVQRSHGWELPLSAVLQTFLESRTRCLNNFAHQQTKQQPWNKVWEGNRERLPGSRRKTFREPTPTDQAHLIAAHPPGGNIRCWMHGPANSQDRWQATRMTQGQTCTIDLNGHEIIVNQTRREKTSDAWSICAMQCCSVRSAPQSFRTSCLTDYKLHFRPLGTCRVLQNPSEEALSWRTKEKLDGHHHASI